jgi:hypothetical protein
MNTEIKTKHLEFIQSAVTRMANNSFLLKGWAVSLVAAVFALSIKELEPEFLLVSLVVLVFFWMLDAYYLALERSFVRLYNDVVSGQPVAELSMDTSKHRRNGDEIDAACSAACSLLYGGLALVHLIILAII